MLKKVMFYLMTLSIASRFFALTYIFSTDISRLPVMVYVVSIAVLILGLFLVCKNIVKYTLQKEISFYFQFNGFAVLVNLIAMKFLSRIEVTVIDFMVIGTLIDLLIGIIFMILAYKHRKYIHVHTK